MFTRRRPSQEERRILGRLLHHRRSECGLTQQQMAELLDCSCHWISDIERGRCDPTWRDVLHWAAVVGLDPQEFAQQAGLLLPEPSHE